MRKLWLVPALILIAGCEYYTPQIVCATDTSVPVVASSGKCGSSGSTNYEGYRWYAANPEDMASITAPIKEGQELPAIYLKAAR